MAFDYLLDKVTNDISLVNGSIQFTNSIEESSRQQVLISLSTYRGEWDFNIEAGIPYLKNDTNPISILGKVDKRIFDSYIIEDILARENIVDVLDYSSVLDKASREIKLSFKAQTLSGEIFEIDDQLLSIAAL